MRRRLRVVGEVGIYWGWRDEGDEARIDIQSAEPGNIRIYEKDGSSLPTRLRLARAGAQSVSVELARKHHRR
jgi:hypothetical protein